MFCRGKVVSSANGSSQPEEVFFRKIRKVDRVLFYPLRDKLYRRSPLAYGMIVSSFLERKLPRIIFSFHFHVHIRTPFDWIFRLWRSPASAGKLVLVGQKTFCRQGHNLLCSLEQRILINSDCHAVFTQKEVFSDQILFQHPLLRSITTCFSVSIRTSGDI